MTRHRPLRSVLHRATCCAAALLAGALPAGAIDCPAADCDPARLAPRVVVAPAFSGSLAIDGTLDEPAWSVAGLASDFVESAPRPAAPASLRSEARVLADGEALYIGLRYYDPSPERITAPLARRDDETTSDWAFVEIDSRHDRRSGFSFGINPRGMQCDGAWLSDTDYDGSWNAVWQAAATIDAAGWTAEFRIPFSQLPFRLATGQETLVWGINFYRYSPAHGESSNWSPRFRGLGGVVSHFNELRVPAPRGVRRLEVTPFVAGRHDDLPESSEPKIAVGFDLHAGLGPNFGLTATVRPDFGQVEADPSQVNLRSFELFQPEHRPFFLEGLDLFRLDTGLGFASRDASFGDESPFYSRRIGRGPQGSAPEGAVVLSRPETSRVEAAAKLAGLTAGEWTVGVFSAFTAGENARVRLADGSSADLQVGSPALTSVGRARRIFHQGRAALGFFLADLRRHGASEALRAEAPASESALGTDFETRFGRRGGYQIRGFALWSRVAGAAEAVTAVGTAPQHYFQRPDAPELGRFLGESSLEGYSAEARLAKVDGALRWDLAVRGASPGFDVNEIGFQRFSDWLLLAGSWQYARLRPWRAVRAWTIGSRNLGAGWTSSGERRTQVADLHGTLDTTRYWHFELAVTRELETLSTDWLQGGPALLLPPRTVWRLAAATDQRRATYASLDAGWSTEPASGSRSWQISPFLNVRSGDHLQWSIGVGRQRDVVGWQFVGRPSEKPAGENVVARARQDTLSLTLRADWSVSARLAIQAYLRPFATVGAYSDYLLLVAPRAESAAARFAPLAPEQIVTGDGEIAFDLDGDGALDGTLPAPGGEQRALDGSLVVRWEYRPGSFLTAVWNQQRDAFESRQPRSPSRALGGLTDDRAGNVLLVKLSRRFGS